MNRPWSTVRDRYSEEAGEGSLRAQQLAAALATRCDAEFLESLLNAKGAMDQFGGQCFIAAKRQKYDPQGNPIDKGVGDFETVGYVFHYGHKATAIRGAEPEPDVPLPVEAPPEAEAGKNGATEPAPVET